MIPVVILAGGMATRMRPITEKIPKALIAIGNKPFIYWQLEYLRDQGISQVVLCLGHYGEMVEKAVGDGEKFGMKVAYSYDGDRLLGTGGAVRKALVKLPNEFFILYGDSYLPIDLKNIENYFFLNKKNALMTILKNKNQWDKSNVIFCNGKLIEYNKKTSKANMQYIDYGLGILRKKDFCDYDDNIAFDLADIYEGLSLKNQLLGYEVFERFYEIGSPKGLQETIEFLLQNRA